MLRFIGAAAVAVALALGIATYTDHVNVSADAAVTEKGGVLYDRGLEETKSLTNKGFDGVKNLADEGFDSLRRDKVKTPSTKK